MKLMLQTYLKKTGELLASGSIIENNIIEQHLHMIAFFAHERFIHLLVTLFIAFVCLYFLCLGFVCHYCLFYIISIILLLLLIPYFFHYYFLENGVQSLYQQYLELIKKRSANN